MYGIRPLFRAFDLGHDFGSGHDHTHTDTRGSLYDPATSIYANPE